jgi:hypothetical protein
MSGNATTKGAPAANRPPALVVTVAALVDELIPFKEVVRLLGRGRDYARKLDAAGVFKVFQPTARVKKLYYRSQIEEMKRQDGRYAK